MKKTITMVVVISLFIALISVGAVLSQELVNFDKGSRTCYISESAWYSLPMTGPASKTEVLQKMNLPPGWKVRGMYTNRLFAEIRWNGDIAFKD